MRERTTPVGARNFLVRIGVFGPRRGRGTERELAFSQVVFPPFLLDVGDTRGDVVAPTPVRSPNLVLRRGHTGSPELYEWWRAERDKQSRRVREVTVILLDDAHRPMTAWRFGDCQVVSLDYSALDALDSGVLMETLEVSFGSVEQIGHD